MGVYEQEAKIWGRTEEGLHNQVDPDSIGSIGGESQSIWNEQESINRKLCEGRDIVGCLQSTSGGTASQLIELCQNQLARNELQMQQLHQSNEELRNAIARMEELRKELDC